MPAGNVLSVIICTYNQAHMLDRVLHALANQKAPGVDWDVVVVDNNCTDETPHVVSSHIENSRLPGLRRIVERTQGLTAARLAGARSTTARWIAFVDDDCIVREGWIAQMAEFLNNHTDAAAIGGQVLPKYEAASPPPYISAFEWCYARQDHGPEPRIVDSLVGAGMVINRSALESSGWLDRPLVNDRIGKRLVSGGDVELSLRLRATGRPVWYTPHCVIDHVIGPYRTEPQYLLRITFGLGISSSIASALTWPQGLKQWQRSRLRSLFVSIPVHMWRLIRSIVGRSSTMAAILNLAFLLGEATGLGKILQMSPEKRHRLLGCAVIGREGS